MKRVIENILLAAVLLAWCGCSRPVEPEETVTVMISPVGAILRAVTAGTGVEVSVVVPPGKDMHEYEPTSLDLRALEHGGPFLSLDTPGEQRLAATVDKMGGDVHILAPDMKRLPFPGGDDDAADGDHGHYHRATDPHVWMSPLNCAVIAESAAEILAARYPEHAVAFRANAEKYAKKMHELSAEIGKQLAPYAGRRFYVLHPAFGYFARDYKLEQCALEREGKRPSPNDVEKTYSAAKKDGIKYVYASPEFNLTHPLAMAKALDAKLVLLEPLPEDPATTFRDIAGKLTAGFEAEKRQ